MFKKSVSKPTTKYAIIGVGVVVALILLYFLISYIAGFSFSSDARLEVKLEDTSVNSNTSTHLFVSVKNTGDEQLIGRLKITPDDLNMILVDYPDKELLRVNLLPQESVVRRLEVTGFSNAVRTDYEILVELMGNNETVIDSDRVVLTVKK